MERLKTIAPRLAALAAIVVVLCSFTPPGTDDPHAVFRWCGFHWLTGRPCPLCGLTRALFALAKGHWGAAIRFHALSPLAAAMLISLPWNWRHRARLWTAGLAAIGVYGIGRAIFPNL